MVRKLVGALSLTALLATGAVAQAPFQQTFTFLSGGAGFYDYHGEFAAGGNIGLTGELPNTSFQIWCVDPLQFVSPNQVYTNAWITPLSVNPVNFTHTLAEFVEAGHTAATGSAAEQEYQKAAYLATQMNAGNVSDYEEAIWQVMGYSGHNGTGANNAIAAMGSSWTTIVPAEWAVITGGTGVQEFIYHRDAGTFLQVTPEPGTMSLLALGMVGMAGSWRRRGKRKR